MSIDPKMAGNIIQILANLPDFLRKPMLTKRLSEFFSMSEPDKHEIIATALAAAMTIEPAKLSVLLKTWLEVVSGFDTEKRATMVSVYCKEAVKNPQAIERLDVKSITDVFLSLDETQKARVTDSLHEVIFAFPESERKKVLAVIPHYARQALKLT